MIHNIKQDFNKFNPLSNTNYHMWLMSGREFIINVSQYVFPTGRVKRENTESMLIALENTLQILYPLHHKELYLKSIRKIISGNRDTIHSFSFLK